MIKERDNKTFAALDQFLENEGELLSRVLLPVSRFVNAEFLEVHYKGKVLPEERGHLHLFPVDEHQYYLQLLFAQYAAQHETIKICLLRFEPGFFEQFPIEILTANQPFRFDKVSEQQFSICSQSKLLLDQLAQVSLIDSPLVQSLQQTEIVLHLLRRSLQCMTQVFAACQVPACRFLAHEQEREKIFAACRIIEQNVTQPFTIRELSRKVAMNECYLKKGFKALTGKTIHEYHQDLRIIQARQLLQQQGRSVSEVANILGFSSISHFSTAFKRSTGLKPCELLA